MNCKIDFYGIKFKINENIIEYFFNQKKTLKDLKKFVDKYIVQQNFHDFFDAKKQIGKGSFASVLLFKFWKNNLINSLFHRFI